MIITTIYVVQRGYSRERYRETLINTECIIFCSVGPELEGHPVHFVFAIYLVVCLSFLYPMGYLQLALVHLSGLRPLEISQRSIV